MRISASPAVPSKPRKILRTLYHLFWYSLAVLVILLAVAVSAIRVFLPDIKTYRQDIEQLASQAMGRQVQIESMDARLDGLTPTVIFSGVRLLDQQKQNELLHFAQARVGLDPFRSLYEGSLIPSSLTISGVELSITRLKTGELTIQGIELETLEKEIAQKQDATAAHTGELSRWLFERSRLIIENSRIIWRDQQHGNQPISLDNVRLKLRNDDLHHQLNGTISLPSHLGVELEFAFDVMGNILLPHEWEGEFYISGKGAKAKNWGYKPSLLQVTLHDGEADFQTWGNWTPQGVQLLSGTVSVSNVHLTTINNVEPFHLKQLAATYDWRRASQGWELRVKDFRYQQADEVWPATAFEARQQNQDEQSIITIHSSLLRLTDLRNLLKHSGLLNNQFQKMLADIHPSGELQELFLQSRIVEDKPVDIVLSSDFHKLSANPYANYPGVSEINGHVWMNAQRGKVDIYSDNTTLTFKKLFRKPIRLTSLETSVNWVNGDDGWHVIAPQIRAQTPDIATDSSLYLVLPSSAASPFMDLQSRFSTGKIAATGTYLPAGIMDRDLVKWLDSGLMSGNLKEGGAVFHGRLHDFPFQDSPGVFEVRFTADDVDMNYNAAWPHFTHMQLDGYFSGTQMRLASSHANLFDSELRDINVTIDDFSSAVLHATGKYEGSARDVIRFLAESAIAPEARDFYNNSRFSGQSQATLDLQIPLDDALAMRYPLRYAGKVTFSDAALSSWDGLLHVNKLNGELDYSTQGVSGRNIAAEVFGGKTDVMVFTHTLEDSQQIKIGLNGILDAGELVRYFELPIADRVNGRARWAGLLSFGYRAGDKDIPGSFTFDTDLQGVRIDLPPPLGKGGGYKRHTSVQFDFPRDNKFVLTADIENEVRGKLVLDTARSNQVRLHKAAINFSNTEPVLPAQSAIKIGGRLTDFTPDAWGRVFSIPDKVKVSKNGNFANLAMPLEIDMDYLSVITSDNPPQGPPPLPTEMPAIGGVIRELKVDDMQLGRFEIASERDKDGIRFRKLQFDTNDMHIRGEGSWLLRQQQHQTNMLFELDSPNVDNMLHRLGYAGVIERGKARANMQASWADAPDRFEFAKLNGTLGVVITDGSIVAVEPGAGRLLGLLSLSELPRHLVLNFKEFQSGLSFDEIKGSFDIANGNAVTNDLNVKSPVAVISIRGRTGFATRDYDLDVVGIPNVTSSVAMISCLLSGGSTCVGGFFFDRLFGKKLDDSLATRYTVKGTWEKPVITEVKSKTVTPPVENSPGG